MQLQLPFSDSSDFSDFLDIASALPCLWSCSGACANFYLLFQFAIQTAQVDLSSPRHDTGKGRNKQKKPRAAALAGQPAISENLAINHHIYVRYTPVRQVARRRLRQSRSQKLTHKHADVDANWEKGKVVPEPPLPRSTVSVIGQTAQWSIFSFKLLYSSGTKCGKVAHNYVI